MKWHHRTISVGWISITVLINMTILYGGWMLFFQGNPPIEIHNNPMPVEKSVYHRGEAIQMFADYCKYSDATGTIYMQFVDGLVFEAPEVPMTNSPLGCEKRYLALIRVPDKLPFGRYSLRGQAVYRINFLTSRTVEWSTEKFDVVE